MNIILSIHNTSVRTHIDIVIDNIIDIIDLAVGLQVLHLRKKTGLNFGNYI
jgi:hypothetical protein